MEKNIRAISLSLLCLLGMDVNVSYGVDDVYERKSKRLTSALKSYKKRKLKKSRQIQSAKQRAVPVEKEASLETQKGYALLVMKNTSSQLSHAGHLQRIPKNLTPTEKSAEKAKIANQKVQEAAKIVRESQDLDVVKQALQVMTLEVQRARLAAKSAQSRLEMSQKNIPQENRRREIQVAVEEAETAKTTAKETAQTAVEAARLLVGDEVDTIAGKAETASTEESVSEK
ncbi:MAG: hypothetical protein LBR92_03735 [Puniceicoccales bacterium]|nr:hypothetical protein [Puniceicoccales bacterium]